MLNESYPEANRQDTLGRNPNTDIYLGLTSYPSLACAVLCGLHHHLQASPEKYMSKKMAVFLDRTVSQKSCTGLLYSESWSQGPHGSLPDASGSRV